MGSIDATVLELLATTQAASKARLEPGWVNSTRLNTVFKVMVGDRELPQTQELLDAADIGNLRPRRDGPFTVTAGPARARAGPPTNTRLRRCRARCQCAAARRGRVRTSNGSSPFSSALTRDKPPPPGLVSDAGQAGKHEVDLPRAQRNRGAAGCCGELPSTSGPGLVRWRGLAGASPADAWRLRVEELDRAVNCRNLRGPGPGPDS